MNQSPRPRLWITRKLTNNTMARAAERYDVIPNPEDRTFNADEIVAMSQEVDAILPCHSEIFDQSVVERLSDRIKIVANNSVGVDHCDLDAFRSRGIMVTNTPDVLSDATAEIAFLLLLGAARRAVEGERLIRTGAWSSWSATFMLGTQVTGKKIGIVGMGRVGQVMARRCRGFDMEVHYYNRNRLAPEREEGAIYHDTLESLLPESEFLSLHCPATPETTDLLNAQTIAQLPDGAIVVNTARGALVVEDDLIEAIKSGKLAAAGLDCFETEPGGNPEMSAYENIFMLPHIGSATFETRDAMGFRALDNLDAYFSGEEPRDRVA